MSETTSSQKIARYALIGLLAALGAWVLRHFLPALCWAVVLAIATSPAYDRWLARFRGRRRHIFAALTFTVLIAVLLLVPLIYGGWVAVRQGFSLVHSLAHNGAPDLPPWLTQLPWVGEWLQQRWTEKLADSGPSVSGVEHAAPAVLEWTRWVGFEVLRRAFTLVFTLLTLFFVYLARERLTSEVPLAMRRLFGPSVQPLLVRAVTAIRATVDGIVIVALAEGAIMGGVYAVAAAPHPALFGLLTAVFAMIPFAVPVVFGAVALVLASSGAVAGAVAVIVAGALVLFIADHFVRPAIIGGAAQIPFLWVLLGILGGVESFGLVGLFLGPALMATLVALWRSWVADSAGQPQA